MEPAESELMTHKSVVLVLLAHETVPPQFKGPQEAEGWYGAARAVDEEADWTGADDDDNTKDVSPQR